MEIFVKNIEYVVQNLNILRKLYFLKKKYNLDNSWRVISCFHNPNLLTNLADSFIYNDKTKDIITIKLLLNNNNNLNNFLNVDDFYLYYKNINIIILNDLNFEKNKDILFNLRNNLLLKYNKNIIIENLIHIDNSDYINRILIDFQKSRNDILDLELRLDLALSYHNSRYEDLNKLTKEGLIFLNLFTNLQIEDIDINI